MSEHWSETLVAPQEPSTAGLPAPKSLLEQMQELLASVNADLAGLGAALQSSGTRTAKERTAPDAAVGSSVRLD